MIRRVFSDLSTFKELTFHSGLNVLLADRTPEATERQTRNGSGKTSLVELVHFVLGANADKDSLFRVRELVQSKFGLEFDLGSRVVESRRSGAQPNRVEVRGADTGGWTAQLALDPDTSGVVIPNLDWRAVLGRLWFGIEDAADDDATFRARPTFRSLFSYLARRERAGGLVSPNKQAGPQQLGDQQIALSFLVGLDWTIASQWQSIREQERSLGEVRRAAGDGALSNIVGNVAQLRTQIALAEERASRLDGRLRSFQVVPEYGELESEASTITRDIRDLANDNTLDRDLATALEESLASEHPPVFEDLAKLYGEIGVALPGVAIRRFAEVEAFHRSVIENRRSYLATEIEAARKRVQDREAAMGARDARRQQILGILADGGALSQYAALQEELSRRNGELAQLRERYTLAERLESNKTDLEIERQRLLVRLREDYREQEAVLRSAILRFEEMSSQLYEEAGSLTIRESVNGPEFAITIHGVQSRGISNMQIFCFDMMIASRLAESGLGPGFLIHDSHLFDGVDSRQVARALEIGAASSRDFGFQYIVTLNSDDVPPVFSDGFSLSDYVLPVKLTDATEDGGLFGLRFN